MSTAEVISNHWLRLKDDVLAACQAANRPAESVRIVGVSKYVDAAFTAELVAAGCHDLGESRPQSLWQKRESGLFDESVNWHLIGQLQTNKINRLLRHPVLIHSLDRSRLIEEISRWQQQESSRPLLEGLVEVNISSDDSKAGFRPDELETIFEASKEAGIATGVQVKGLMAMAGWGTDQAEAQRQFARLRELRDKLVEKFDIELPELSMGMSGDFQAAIEEGSTMIRIGSRLFEGIPRRT